MIAPSGSVCGSATGRSPGRRRLGLLHGKASRHGLHGRRSSAGGQPARGQHGRRGGRRRRRRPGRRAGRSARRRRTSTRALDRLDGRTLVIAGGDGSLHLAVTKLHLRGALGRPRIGLVPLGTGNDLARALEHPARPGRGGRAGPRRRGAADRPGPRRRRRGRRQRRARRHRRRRGRARRARSSRGWARLAYPIGAVRAGLRSTGWRLRVEVDGAARVRRPPAHAHGRHRQRPRASAAAPPCCRTRSSTTACSTSWCRRRPARSPGSASAPP